LFTQHASEIDAVIVESSLFGVAEREVLGRLRAIRPGAKILLIGGYVDDSLRALGSSLQGVPLLHRPYVPDQLLESVRQLLDQPMPRSGAPAPGARQGVKRRVLVVDDEPAVRLFCERVLRETHAVTAVSTGQDALQALRGEPFDLLLTDVVMPEMDGITLLDEAGKLRPGVRMVAMSGSLTDEMERRLLQTSPGCQILRKPFDAGTLQKVLERCF
jgi:CheY-like chemotaxis protein